MSAKRSRRNLTPADDLPRSRQGIPYRYELKRPPEPPPALPASRLAEVREGLHQSSQRFLFDILVARPGITMYRLSLALGMDGSMPYVRLARMRKSLQRFGLTINRPTGGVYFGGNREAGSRLWIEEWHENGND